MSAVTYNTPNRMVAQKAAMARRVPFCAFCFDLGKTERDYTSHFVRATPDPNSCVVCPELKACTCLNCGKRGHTAGKCKKAYVGRIGIDAPYKERYVNKPTPKIQPKNIFALLLEDDMDSDIETEAETVFSDISTPSITTTENEVSMRTYAMALKSVIQPKPVNLHDSLSVSTSSSISSVFKGIKFYKNWADADYDSSDDEC